MLPAYQNITPDSLNDFRQKLCNFDGSDVLLETYAEKAYIMFLSIIQKLYVSCYFI